MTEDDNQYLIMWEDFDDRICISVFDHVFVPSLDHETLKAAMGCSYWRFLEGKCEIYEVKRVHILRNE